MSITSLAHFFSFSLIALAGVIEIIGVGTFVAKATLLFALALLVLIKTQQQGRIGVTSNSLNILLFSSCLIALYIFDAETLVLFVGVFQIISPFIIYAALKFLIKKDDFYTTRRVFVVFIILQLIASLIKFLVIGVNEGQGVGTVSIQAGALSSYIIFFIAITPALFKLKAKSALIVFLTAVLFMIINDKRIGVLIIPLGGVAYLYYKAQYRRLNLTLLLKYTAVLFAIFVIITQIMPSSLDGRGVANFYARVMEYLTQVSENGSPVGRLAGLINTYSVLINDGNLLFGNGPAEFLSSGMLGLTNNTNLGYNAVGATIVMGRFGLLGVIGISLLLLYLYKTQYGPIGRLFALWIMFDVLIYSSGFFLSYLGIYMLIIIRNIEVDLTKIKFNNVGGSGEKFSHI